MGRDCTLALNYALFRGRTGLVPIMRYQPPLEKPASLTQNPLNTAVAIEQCPMLAALVPIQTHWREHHMWPAFSHNIADNLKALRISWIILIVVSNAKGEQVQNEDQMQEIVACKTERVRYADVYIFSIKLFPSKAHWYVQACFRRMVSHVVVVSGCHTLKPISSHTEYTTGNICRMCVCVLTDRRNGKRERAWERARDRVR